ncbi:Glycoside hydrolase family 5 protein [Pyrenophora tritici-repentis]|nr:Glycoside hydrolase family 5 protein [Pyrenophora tritici-repentis]
MKIALFLALAAIVAALRAAVDVASRATVSKVDGLKFNIDGVTKYFSGTNAYWMPFLTNDSDVDSIMGHLANSGQRILRIWGFNDVETIPSAGTIYFQSFSGSSATINTGADGLQRLDAVVNSAEKHGIKLIINFVNNWDDYGGMKGSVILHVQWYTSAKCQAMYQAYIEAVISRYRTSNAVFAWELANEPRCTLCPTSVLTDWVRKTSDYIRSLDSDHMIAIGDEGFGLTGGISFPYLFLQGLDWETNLALPNISFGTFHFYPDSFLVGNAAGDGWIEAHARICQRLNKPCLFEEYGVKNKADHCPVEGNWQKTSLGLKDQGMAVDLFWQLGDTIVSEGRLTHDDGFTIYYGSEDWKCLVDEHVKAIG